MAKMTKAQGDANLRSRVFSTLFDEFENDFFVKINDRQYGCILTDKNGVKRYVRVGVIVAEEREDMTAEELMAREIADYNAKQEAKAEKAKAKEEKIARDKARREAKEKEKEAQENA